MRDLAKSFIDASLALTLLGSQQLTDTLYSRPSAALPRRHPFDRAISGVRANLSDRFNRVYDVGDDAQQGLVDFAQALRRLDAAGIVIPAINIVNPLFEGLATFAPNSDWPINWRELRNKLDIYDLVRNIERRLAITDGTSLAELLERAYALGEFHALWAIEGLGHYYAERSFQIASEPSGLLKTPHLLGLPDQSLCMLNAGIGLAFGARILETANNRRIGIRQAVESFKKLCDDNTTLGYRGCALESLGLVARTYFPSLVMPLDSELCSAADEATLGFFWHGIGRAAYFAMWNLPLTGVRTFEELVQAVPHATGKMNFLSGFSWAITLVNMRTPEVMEKVLRVHATELQDAYRAAFHNGMVSSIVMRYATTPGADVANRYCKSRATAANNDSAHDFILSSCRLALHHIYPRIRREGGLEQVFRYQPPACLITPEEKPCKPTRPWTME